MICKVNYYLLIFKVIKDLTKYTFIKVAFYRKCAEPDVVRHLLQQQHSICPFVEMLCCCFRC